MYYFKEKEGMVKKYEVHFDKEQIEALEKRIIEKCSILTHHTERVRDFPENVYHMNSEYEQNPKITNLSYEMEDRDSPYSQLRYKFSYDRYDSPYLANLIDELLKGNSQALIEIYSYQADKTITDNQLMFNNLKIKLNEISKNNGLSPKQMKEELEKICERLDVVNKYVIESDTQLANKQQVLNNYCEELISYITLTLVSEISLTTIKEAEEKQAEVTRFFATDSAILEETSPTLNLHHK